MFFLKPALLMMPLDLGAQGHMLLFTNLSIMFERSIMHSGSPSVHVKKYAGISMLLQGRLASGEDIFGPLIRKYLLENKHRVSVEMLPDKDLAAQREAAERERLATMRSAMGPEDIEAVIRETRELKERQVSAIFAGALSTHCAHSRYWHGSNTCGPILAG